MRKSLLFTIVILVALGAGQTSAQWFQGPYGPGGTWNLYELVSEPVTWVEAYDDAVTRSAKGVSGNLVDILSVDENNAVYGLGAGVDLWLGATDREGAAPQITNNGILVPQESQELANRLTNGWAWTTGEPFVYHNWAANEPNNWDGAAAGTALTGYEDVIEMNSSGFWNDGAGGFFENEPIAPVLQPGTSTAEDVNRLRGYVVEYQTKAAMAYGDVELLPAPPRLIPLSADLPGIPGGVGYIGVTDFSTGATVTVPAIAVAQTLTAIARGELDAESYSGEFPTSNLADLGSSGGGGPILADTPHDLPISAALGGSVDDFISVGKAFVSVPEAGIYTINVHSDDGFALELPGKVFTASGGNGALGEGGAVLYNSANTGDSNTQGLIELPAGNHALNFYMWERDGGAYWEITTAKGNFTQPIDGVYAQWLAIGDASVVDERNEGPPVGLGQLTQPLHIANINGITPADGLEFLREEVLSAIDAGTVTAESNDGQIFVIDDHGIVTDQCPFTVYPHNGVVTQFPNSKGGADIDNFATGIFGKFTIDNRNGVDGETYEVTVHVDSDDRGMFRIIGESFTDWDAQELYNIDGDEVMFADVDVCNTNFSALIELTEGVEYEFEAFHVEAGGNSGMQILFAEGNLLGIVDPEAFLPLAIPGADGVTFVRNVGWGLAGDAGIPYDFDGDGSLGLGDINLLLVQVNSGANNPTYDVNSDGLVNEGDINSFVTDADKLNTYIGDADLNGEFTSADFVTVFLAGEYEDTINDNSTWEEGDWNGDLDFTSSDFVSAFLDGGYELGPKLAVSAVPEPSSLLLALLSLLGVFGFARKRCQN